MLNSTRIFVWTQYGHMRPHIVIVFQTVCLFEFGTGS